MKIIIRNFDPAMGNYCITSPLAQVFRHFDHPLPEEVIFGLAAGISFEYLELETIPFPLLFARTPPVEFENYLAQSTGTTLMVSQTSDPEQARYELIAHLQKGKLVIAYVDMGMLPYLGLPPKVHLGTYSFVVFGIDTQEGHVYVSDRESTDYRFHMNDLKVNLGFHILPLLLFETACNSLFEPYPPQNRRVVCDLSLMKAFSKEMVNNAIRINCMQMLHSNSIHTGLKGIQLAASKVLSWADYEPDLLKLAAFHAFFLLGKLGGNMVGGFRHMYSDFLKYSGHKLRNSQFEKIGKGFAESARMWDETGQLFLSVFRTEDKLLLYEISSRLKEIHKLETNLFTGLASICGL